MATKDKAKELFEKMYNKIQPDELGKDQESAKQCALIAVEEILNECPSKIYWDTYNDETPSAVTFWQEVKQEIINL